MQLPRPHREHLQFALAGILGLVVDVLSLYLLLLAGSGFYLGRALSFLLAVIATWLVNRHYTFSAGRAQSDKGLIQEFGHYLLAMSGGGAINYAVYSLLVWQLPPAPWLALLAVAAGSLSGMVFNFCAAKWLVFR